MGKKPKKESTARITPSSLVYQMKVTLKGIRPPIWRRIQVPANFKLKAFEVILQTVMGWGGGHLHEFDIHGVSYGDLSQFEKGDVLDEKKIRLDQLITGEKEKFFYVYDFGDNWEHEILLEKILPIDPGTQYPVCLSGKRSCPPEDSGGPWGYEELLEIIKNPEHSEHEDTLEWLGGDFDPEWFDRETINMELEGIRNTRRQTRCWDNK
ncbi:MAG: plasmid pRiA4b ORF-3 family protein [Desulfomonile sp.]